MVTFMAGGIIVPIFLELIRKHLNKPKPDIQFIGNASTLIIDEKKLLFLFINLSAINIGNAASIVREFKIHVLSDDDLIESKGDLKPGCVLAPHGGKASFTSKIRDFPGSIPDTLDIKLSADNAPPISHTIKVSHNRIYSKTYGDESSQE